MEALIDSIQAALRDGATDEERRRAAESCRALADAFAPPEPPEPPATAVTLALAPAAIPASISLPALVPAAMSPFAGMTADQILDLAIAKLRAAAGPVDPDTVGMGFRLTLVPVPRIT